MRESQGAKLSCRTLRSLAMAGCDVRVSHPAIFFELFSAKPNLMAKSMPIYGLSVEDREPFRDKPLSSSGKRVVLPEDLPSSALTARVSDSSNSF